MTDENKNPDHNPAQDGGPDALADAERIVNDAAANDGDQDGQEPTSTDAPGSDSQHDEAAEAIDRAQQAAAEHLADLQRLQAEYVNYRKRVDRDRDAAGDLATVKLIEALIPTLDDIAGAREHGDLEGGPFKAIAAKLEEALGRFGWTSYGAPGEEFDPQFHEALMSQPSSDVDVPTIQEMVQQGHRVGDRVVRPARVVVSQPE